VFILKFSDLKSKGEVGVEEIRSKKNIKKIRFPAWCAAVPAGQPPPETLLTAAKPVGFWEEHHRIVHGRKERGESLSL